MVQGTLEKLRMTAGSVIVDVTLVIVIVWSGGQYVEQLKGIERRVQRLEEISVESELSVLKVQVAGNTVLAGTVKEDVERNRKEIVSRLDRMEDKIDRLGH